MTQQNPLGSSGGADEFEIMRQRLKSRGAARGAEAQRGVARQAAALGNLPSGAALKQRQFAAQQTEDQTSQELQDVNVLQAQTQRAERESAAGRELQRFGITEQSRIAEAGQGIQRFGIEQQAETARAGQGVQRFGIEQQASTAKAGQAIQQFGIEEQSRVATAAQTMQESIAKQGWAADKDILADKHANDMALLAEQGATQLELQTAQNRFDAKALEIKIGADANAAKLVERGVNDRLAQTIASNKNLQAMADDMAQKGIDIQQQLADHSETVAGQEAILNQFATIVNSFDPLRAAGFTKDTIFDMFESMDLPFAEQLEGAYSFASQSSSAPIGYNQGDGYQPEFYQ